MGRYGTDAPCGRMVGCTTAACSPLPLHPAPSGPTGGSPAVHPSLLPREVSCPPPRPSPTPPPPVVAGPPPLRAHRSPSPLITPYPPQPASHPPYAAPWVHTASVHRTHPRRYPPRPPRHSAALCVCISLYTPRGPCLRHHSAAEPLATPRPHCFGGLGRRRPLYRPSYDCPCPGRRLPPRPPSPATPVPVLPSHGSKVPPIGTSAPPSLPYPSTAHARPIGRVVAPYLIPSSPRVPPSFSPPH
jgi:hypothetical protein